MKKISIGLVVIMMLSLLLTGCSDEEKPVAVNSPKVIKIGVLEPLTGADAAGGELEKMGIDLAHELYPTVTIDGKKIPIELEYADNKSDKQESVNGAKSLVNKYKADMVIGSWGSANSIAAGAVFREAEVPAIGASCTNSLVTLGNDYYFRVCFVDSFQGAVMANYAFQEGKYQKIGIIQETASAYSVPLAEVFSDTFKKLTQNEDCITSVENYNGGDQDFRAQLLAIRNSGAEAIFCPGDFTESALIMKQARELGIRIPFLGTDTWETPTVIEVAGLAAEGAVYSSFYDPQAPLTEMTATFLDAFAAKYGKEELAAGVTACGFDAYLLAIQTIEKAGTVDGPTLRDTLAKTENFEGATGFITLDEND
ncbi:MAG: ABC transporter substrate-binding protein [Anaerovorax sp.]